MKYAALEGLWSRDYWQRTARPRRLEGNIAPTPLALSALTEESWRQALCGALGCLDASRGRMGRARQRVTLARGSIAVEGEVSPHLTLKWFTTQRRRWQEFFAEGKELLQPYYEWARTRTAPDIIE